MFHRGIYIHYIFPHPARRGNWAKHGKMGQNEGNWGQSRENKGKNKRKRGKLREKERKK